MNAGLISVIVPAYNASRFLMECIHSIQSQTYESLELLIIDDGSTDDTSALVQAVMQNDSRIRYFRQSNLGVSTARNRGIEEATGEYISFVDADDWISPFFFEKGIAFLRQFELDIMLGQTQFVYENRENKNPEPGEDTFRVLEGEGLTAYEAKVLSNGVIGDKMLSHTFTSGPVCKIFKSSFLGSVRFNTNLIRGEDVVFNLELARKHPRVGLTNAVWYYYRQNNQSVTKQYNPMVLGTTLVLISTLYEMYRSQKEMLPFLQVRTVKQLYGALLIGPCARKSPLSGRERICEIETILSSYPIDRILDAENMRASFPGSAMDKLFFLLAKRHMVTALYALLCVYRRMKNK